MFKLPDGIPSLKSSTQEWADYAEFLALKTGNVSLYNLTKTPQLVSDEPVISGVEDTSDKFGYKADEISSEINRRRNLGKHRYPYQSADFGYTVQFADDGADHTWIYKYLLLSTRVKMKQQKVQNGVDGTHLLERLSAEVAKQFFGENSQVDVMGTSKSQVGGFREKLGDLTKRMKEGGDIHQNPGYQPQDDNVDVILWKGFTDQMPSQIIAFGQCKTGTSWSDKLSELNTEAFCKTWFTRQPVLTPIRMFFCSQYFPNEIWIPRANEAGLVFDRFRILDYLPDNLSDNLMNDIRNWCDGAIAAN